MTPRWKCDTAAQKKFQIYLSKPTSRRVKKKKRLNVMAGRLTAPTSQGKITASCGRNDWHQRRWSRKTKKVSMGNFNLYLRSTRRTTPSHLSHPFAYKRFIPLFYPHPTNQKTKQLSNSPTTVSLLSSRAMNVERRGTSTLDGEYFPTRSSRHQ